MKTNPITNPTVAAELTRRTCEPIHPPPPHVGGYALTLRRSTLHALTLLCGAALLTHATFAAKPGPTPPPPPSSGTLVLDYQYLGNPGTAENFGLGVASGTIYSSGKAYNTPGLNPAHGIVLASTDGGSTWSLVDDFAPPGLNVKFSTDIVSDATGNLYVAGVYWDDISFVDHWIVRRSSDAGATWTTVDDFDAGTDDFGEFPPTDIAVDAAGDVYVVGWSNPNVAGGTTHAWTVRKGAGGTLFSTVDVLTSRSLAQGIFVHPTAGLFVVGSSQIVIRNQLSSAWVVRQSTDGGSTWSTLETYQLSSGTDSGARDVGADAAGNVYVVGYGGKPARGLISRHWIVRKSTNGGASFSTVDDFGTNSRAQQIARTPNGDLYAAGVTVTSSGENQIIVRKSAGGTGAWTTIDDYQQPGFYAIETRSMVADANGSLFVSIGSESGLWVVKKY